ncbi:MAG TPA: EF-hand domain-containing protein [Gemmataceae bacterium]|nr:EF-hand domain-containing protein [Gemmataceae bacterium]
MKQIAGLSLLAMAIGLLTFVRPALSADQKNNVDLESVFKILDVNNDKVVTLKEFQSFDGLGRIKVVTNKDKDKEKDAKTRTEIFKKLDTNKDGKLTFEEFKKINDIINDYALNKKKK